MAHVVLRSTGQRKTTGWRVSGSTDLPDLDLRVGVPVEVPSDCVAKLKATAAARGWVIELATPAEVALAMGCQPEVVPVPALPVVEPVSVGRSDLPTPAEGRALTDGSGEEEGAGAAGLLEAKRPVRGAAGRPRKDDDA